ncbi:hypothetical protein [Micromonospora sonneratiae]|uniref:Uncharacterized protein n=1 Tax=Micromonospora sonneratiae TaxID=1184706 RepID=A0ABW3YLE6_9ACTN
MARHRRTSGYRPQPRDAVAESLGGGYWSVDATRWATVAPQLPEELADLLAPPIVVRVAPAPIPAGVRPNPPGAVSRSRRTGGRHRRPAATT